MKLLKCLLLCVCLLIAKISNAQIHYQPVFGNYNTTWNIIAANLDQTWVDSFYTAGDTIINSFQYKIIKTDLENNTVYLRSDSSNTKLWALTVHNYPGKTYLSEYLIMDLSLSVGDSFYTYNPNGVKGYYKVDSVFNYVGRKYVRLNDFNSNRLERLTFIEGVSANAGFFYADTMDTYFGPYILCKHDKDTLVYSSVLYNHDCRPLVAAAKSFEGDEKVEIFPNPVTEKLTVKRTTGLIKAIQICDILGRQLITKLLLYAEPEYEIDVSALPQGIYILTTKTRNGQQVVKFIKE